jgi:hypothetical protein
VAKQHDVKNEIKMLLNINDIYAFCLEIQRLAELPVYQKITAIMSKPNPNITDLEKTTYRDAVKQYKLDPDSVMDELPIKEYIATLKKPTIKQKYTRLVNLNDPKDVMSYLLDKENLKLKNIKEGKPWVDTRTQVYKKFTDSSKNANSTNASKKNLTLKIEYDDKRSNTNPTFEQKNNPDMLTGEILTHYNLKVIETKNRKNTMVPQYIPKHLLLAFAQQGLDLMKQIEADHVLLNHIITPMYFSKK